MAAEGGDFVKNYRGEWIPVVWFTYTGADGEVIDDEATHIFVDKDCTVVRAQPFRNHPNIVEVICDEDVEKIERWAFWCCPSLRRVIMPGVKIVEDGAFEEQPLEYVECDKLEIIGQQAFCHCSLRKINLPSVRIVSRYAFAGCEALTDVKFGSKLERIKRGAFRNCKSLERITIPLKDGLIDHEHEDVFFTTDGVFQGCENLHQVDLVEGELHETIAALHLEEWRDDMNKEIDSINQILPTALAGWWDNNDELEDPGEKTHAIRNWIRSVLGKIIHYQAEHRRLLDDAATALVLVSPNNDIVTNNVLPFLEIPAYTFEVGDDDDEDDSDEDTDSSDEG